MSTPRFGGQLINGSSMPSRTTIDSLVRTSQDEIELDNWSESLQLDSTHEMGWQATDRWTNIMDSSCNHWRNSLSNQSNVAAGCALKPAPALLTVKIDLYLAPRPPRKQNRSEDRTRFGGYILTGLRRLTMHNMLSYNKRPK